MKFSRHELAPALASDIEAIFHYSGFVPDHSIERVVPTGHAFLLFELDGFERHTYDDALEVTGSFTRAWVAGNRHHHLAISAHPDSEMLAVQFKPGGARPYLHCSLDDLSGRVLPAQELFGDEVLALREEILSTPVADKFARVTAWLSGRRDEAHEAPPQLRTMFEALSSCSAADYGQLFEAYPHTQKHLIDQFKAFVGLTPKTFQRVVRFNEILGRVHAKQELAWAELALDCGYADQSHFIREFRRFSGFRPSDFVAAGFDEAAANFFPLDRDVATDPSAG